MTISFWLETVIRNIFRTPEMNEPDVQRWDAKIKFLDFEKVLFLTAHILKILNNNSINDPLFICSRLVSMSFLAAVICYFERRLKYFEINAKTAISKVGARCIFVASSEIRSRYVTFMKFQRPTKIQIGSDLEHLSAHFFSVSDSSLYFVI